ncbi:PTS sugar transporter subunit IIA [Thermoactinomyces mirandus]|uniref:PTS sugar transporter subunit IIA n=1 Tax=Thermoactinomyces mirandus TaxID=2756294 RepID=UPI0028AF97B7|nr:PTS sugar transporter subunit IIA [Thermoactinomyces mirandus]
MESVKSLFREELIFMTDLQTQEEVFAYIGDTLLQKGLVKKGFTESILEREKNYPTGLDLNPVADDMPNVAIPHTETEYCNDKAVVFVKLDRNIPFRNMIEPDRELTVKYLFFIVNHEKNSQTNILSELIEFMTNREHMKKLESLKGKKEIYDFLTSAQ